MKPYPLTIGLVMSAAMRSDHSMMAPYDDEDIMSKVLGAPEKRIPKVAEKVISSYRSLAAGESCDPQIAEEFLGQGFYSPEKEASYAGFLDPYPGVLAQLQKLIEA